MVNKFLPHSMFRVAACEAVKVWTQEFWFCSEVVDGSGPMAKTGDTLEFNFVCRRSNGYFVYRWVGCYSLMLYFLSIITCCNLQFVDSMTWSVWVFQRDLSLSLCPSFRGLSQVKPYHAIPIERVGFGKAKQPSVRVGCLVLRLFQEISRIDPIYVGFLCRT